MPLTYNGNAPAAATYNGNPVGEVTYNGVMVWRAAPSYPPYLKFSSANPFSIESSVWTPTWDGTMEYSTDASTWSVWDATTISAAESNGTYYLYMRGSGNTIVTGAASSGFGISASAGTEVSCDGDIRTLLQYNDVENVTPGARCFMGLFATNSYLVKAPDLLLDTVPVGGYNTMFYGCVDLRYAPRISAAALNNACMASMFLNCTSLVTLPALKATVLPTACYQTMFSGCSLIKLSETQTGEYQTPYRIPIEGTGSMGSNSTANMFANTGGTFTGSPTINTTYYTSNTVVS